MGRVTAMVWDFDGTLADTRAKNLNVTRRIIEALTGEPYGQFPMLRSLEAYESRARGALNWRELYRKEFDFADDAIDRAGRLWTQYQLADDTTAALFDGIADVVRELGTLPHGIVSQNAQASITRALAAAGIDAYFRLIVGFEEVPLDRQKPAPDGLLRCVEALTGLTPGLVVYVGDHDSDMRCALAAQRELDLLGAAVEVLAVGAQFGAHAGDWSVPPRYLVRSPGELLAVVASL